MLHCTHVVLLRNNTVVWSDMQLVMTELEKNSLFFEHSLRSENSKELMKVTQATNNQNNENWPLHLSHFCPVCVSRCSWGWRSRTYSPAISWERLGGQPVPTRRRAGKSTHKHMVLCCSVVGARHLTLPALWVYFPVQLGVEQGAHCQGYGFFLTGPPKLEICVVNLFASRRTHLHDKGNCPSTPQRLHHNHIVLKRYVLWEQNNFLFFVVILSNVSLCQMWFSSRNGQLDSPAVYFISVFFFLIPIELCLLCLIWI